MNNYEDYIYLDRCGCITGPNDPLKITYSDKELLELLLKRHNISRETLRNDYLKYIKRKIETGSCTKCNATNCKRYLSVDYQCHHCCICNSTDRKPRNLAFSSYSSYCVICHKKLEKLMEKTSFPKDICSIIISFMGNTNVRGANIQ
jgi:hypothetical protein